MKRLLFILLLTPFICNGASLIGSGVAEEAAASYRFYWSCDTLPTESTESATTLYDASGNYKIWRSHSSYALVDVAGHDGTTGGAWGQDRASWQNARIAKDAVPTDAATIKMYIYKDSARDPGSLSYLIKTNDYDENNSFAVYLNGSNGYIYVYLKDGSGTASYIAADAGLSDDTWYLLEVSFDIAAHTMSYSINGTVKASKTNMTVSAISAWGTESDASIGVYVDDFGRFDEIYIYQD